MELLRLGLRFHASHDKQYSRVWSSHDKDEAESIGPVPEGGNGKRVRGSKNVYGNLQEKRNK